MNECVRATILSDRCHKYHDAALAQQVREAGYRETCKDELEVERLVGQLAAEPNNSVAGLLRFTEGCKYLIGRWEVLGRVLEEFGFWNAGDRDEAIRLQGVRAEDDQLKNSDVAWTTRLFNLLSCANPNGRIIDWMMQPGQMPSNLRSLYRSDYCPGQEECQALLKALVAEKIALTRVVLVELEEAHEAAAKQSAPDRAMILQDEKAAKLFLRYSAESRSAFHRSFKEAREDARPRPRRRRDAPGRFPERTEGRARERAGNHRGTALGGSRGRAQGPQTGRFPERTEFEHPG